MSKEDNSYEPKAEIDKTLIDMSKSDDLEDSELRDFIKDEQNKEKETLQLNKENRNKYEKQSQNETRRNDSKENNKEKINDETHFNKKAIPFIAHLLGFIFISTLIFGAINSPRLFIKDFYNSFEFNNIFKYYTGNVLYYVDEAESGTFSNLEEKKKIYDEKAAQIDAKYDEKINNLESEVDGKIASIREETSWDEVNKFLDYYSMSYDEWKSYSQGEQELRLNEYKNKLLNNYEYSVKGDLNNERLREKHDIAREIFGRDGLYTVENMDNIEYNAKKQYNNLKFYAVNKKNGNVYTNIENLNKDNFSEENLINNSRFYMIIKGNESTGISNINTNMSQDIFNLYYDLYFNNEQYKDWDIYYSVPQTIRLDDQIYKIIKSYDNNISANTTLWCIGISSVGTLLYLLYLIIRRKRYFNEGFLDKLYRKSYTEIKLVLTVLGVFGGGVLGVLFFEGYFNVYYYEYMYIPLLLLSAIGCITTLLTVLLFNIKYIKNSGNVFIDVFRRSIIFRITKFICKITYKGVVALPKKYKKAIEVSYFKGEKVYKYWVAIGVGILTIIVGGAITLLGIIMHEFVLFMLPCSLIVGCFIIYFVISYMDSLQQVVKATTDICNGNFNVNVEEKGDVVTKTLARNINNINNGLKVALENEIRSERMKGELITNVSHDLKTPLTSIINYIDLLKDDRTTEEEKQKYLEILDRKSQRLKVLIEDLFEVSKATTGSMELTLEDIEVKALLKQTFGELKEKIDSSKINFRTKFAEGKHYCRLDGKKTWRIFENLIVNILKYSLPGSRAYIELNDLGDKVQVVMKNTSNEEIVFTSDEIVERFKRGDVSRNTEGSGLGLAISKSLVELQNGEFNIDIDGDLFKVKITFNKVVKE